MSRTTLLSLAVGLLVGAVLVLILPHAWLFVDGGAAGEHVGHAGPADDGIQYACPMFCVVMDEKTDDGRCPVCGMELAPLSQATTLNVPERHMIGLASERARRVPLVRSVRSVGEVDYDESRVAKITTRVSGWLRDVPVDAAWTEIEAGQVLASIYSPEVYAAERELLQAVARADGADGGTSAARKRLELLGVDPRDVDELLARGTARDEVVLRSPRGGVITRRIAEPGAAVKRGDLLFAVADLDRVWVQAEVLEDDLAAVRVGQAVHLVPSGGHHLEGRVAFVDPVVDRARRTARVRIEVANRRESDGTRRLRIGQRVDVRIEARLDADGEIVAGGEEPGADPLAVPRSAVLRTGLRAIVYVLYGEHEVDGEWERRYDVDPARLPKRLGYEPVQVRLGPLSRVPGDGALEELYPVLGVVAPRLRLDALTSLEAGHVVVTAGNLLLDSQAQLAGRPSLLFPEGNRGAPSSDAHSGH